MYLKMSNLTNFHDTVVELHIALNFNIYRIAQERKLSISLIKNLHHAERPKIQVFSVALLTEMIRVSNFYFHVKLIGLQCTMTSTHTKSLLQGWQPLCIVWHNI